MVSLDINKEDDWLKLKGSRERFDSINTLVMNSVTTAVRVRIGDDTVHVYFRYPVHSLKYYHHDQIVYERGLQEISIRS